MWKHPEMGQGKGFSDPFCDTPVSPLSWHESEQNTRQHFSWIETWLGGISWSMLILYWCEVLWFQSLRLAQMIRSKLTGDRHRADSNDCISVGVTRRDQLGKGWQGWQGWQGWAMGVNGDQMGSGKSACSLKDHPHHHPYPLHLPNSARAPCARTAGTWGRW